ncbi:hypothetical protein ADJ73_09615 [Arsenicicoccus sp. oral taxon 190]|nr:hypothetical protein ADJ73_09615 [Arsenicicoccus sp. oral taxon 190]
MDVAGPAQVFTNAAEITDSSYDISYVAAAPLTTAHQGLGLVAPTRWPELQPGDLVLVPGWKTENSENSVEHPVGGLDGALLERIRAHWERGGQIASICAGALALAEAGILREQAATTHHDLVSTLAQCPGVTVAQDVLFTCAERLHTSAGIASGIDLCLHLVAHDHGPALAARVARTLVVPAWRSGNATQASVLLVHRDHMDDLVHRAQDILDDPTGRPLSLAQLAGRLEVSGRTLTRHFTRATGLTPQAYATAVRREHAALLHGQGWTWDAAARAVGYADARSLRSRRVHP